jgi:hypothetical protein
MEIEPACGVAVLERIHRVAFNGMANLGPVLAIVYTPV